MDIKFYQHLSLQGTPKFSQIGILGLKIYHLAAMIVTLSGCTYVPSAARSRRRAMCETVQTALMATSSKPT
jgi:hypothetical protein